MEAILLITVGSVLMLLIINITLLVYSIYQKFADGIIYAAFTSAICIIVLYFVSIIFPLLKQSLN